jgi:hypothetical protein
MTTIFVSRSPIGTCTVSAIPGKVGTTLTEDQLPEELIRLGVAYEVARRTLSCLKEMKQLTLVVA